MFTVCSDSYYYTFAIRTEVCKSNCEICFKGSGVTFLNDIEKKLFTIQIIISFGQFQFFVL